ncbi:MAG: glycosyl hydrolase, partial [Gammaproteobacteria bacterium]|nr:glycosyl hydrolase [Gammaproteobacteria bacterium]
MGRSFDATRNSLNSIRNRTVFPLLLACFTVAILPRPAVGADHSIESHDPKKFGALRFRHIGPYRGGRSTAVAGITDQPFTFYMGSTGGGVFKTTDAGTSWANVSDGFFAAGSIGAISVAESDPNIVYVGTGSACPRGNISPGIGMYKSMDGGETWRHIGLDDAGQIGKLAVHPTNPNLLYVAVLGQIFGPSEERGVYRSRDGGDSWEKVLFLSDETGAVDIKMDPENPAVLYAAFWRAERKPWTIISGGDEGGIYKSTDGGDNWNKLTEGLPTGMTGRIGIAVSPANANRIWAIIEGERTASGFKRDETGMYRSD